MNEETLTLYYYNDGLSDAERRDVESALAADPELARQYQALCRQLDGLADVEAQRAPAHLVERWHDIIDRAAEREAVAARAATLVSLWFVLLGNSRSGIACDWRSDRCVHERRRD